jgi:hypothetical protein
MNSILFFSRTIIKTAVEAIKFILLYKDKLHDPMNYLDSPIPKQRGKRGWIMANYSGIRKEETLKALSMMAIFPNSDTPNDL